MNTRRWLARSILALAGILGSAGILAAQEGNIVGTVRTQAGEPVAGGQVTIHQGAAATAPAARSALTEQNGRFLLLRVPVGEWTVRVELIGYGTATRTVTVVAGQSVTADIVLTSEAIALDEIVVTGVTGATVRAKVPFDIAQVSAADLVVPSVSAGSAIQGKVAGATVFQGTSRPGAAPSVLLRGATSINADGRSQDPLYIVDGVILSGDMADIDGIDIENVEVVKGAAAASLYGSRAANGVVQITTKRGASMGTDQVRYTFRSEIGTNRLPDAQVTTLKHPFRMNAAGTAFIDGSDGSECQWLDCTSVQLAGQAAGAGETVTEWNTYTNQAWPGRTFNNVERFFSGGDHMENYVSASGRSGGTNFHVSFSNLGQGGIMRGLEGFNRNNFRLNLDQSVREDFTLSASAFYSTSDQDVFSENSGTPMFRLTRQPAGVDLLSCEDDITRSCENDPENLILVPNPFNASESANPVYEQMVEKFKEDRDRFLSSVNARWAPMSWLAVDGNASFDRLDRQREQRFPKGYRTVGQNASLNNGSLFEENRRQEAFNTSITASTNFRLTDGISNRSQFRYLYEQEDIWSSNLTGYEFSVEDLYTFDNVKSSTFDGGSFSQSIRSDGYFLISNFDIYDRYIVDGLVRNDGSSLFGEDNRRAWYYRVAGAWRLGEEPWFNLDAVDELKLRAAYGTAGNRPRFVAQYETYNVSGGVITPVSLGNTELKPERSAEIEIGLDASFLTGRFGAGLTYANTVTTDQILQVPLAAFTGFGSQYQNAGTLESTTWEASLEARLLRSENVSWSARLLFDRTRSKITELSVPAFTYGVGGQGLGTVYFAREGEEMGTFYGTQVPTSCAHLPDGVDCSLFEVNDDGIMVYTGGTGFDNPQWGASYALPGGATAGDGAGEVSWGTPFSGYCTDRVSGEKTNYCPVGKAVPDYHVSLSSTFNWKGFQLYGLLDSEQNFDVYNQTAQWATFRSNSALMETGENIEGTKPQGYYNRWYVGSGRLSPTTLFVEDGSYIKLREVSARYTFGENVLGSVPGLNRLSGLTLSATGRNLYTWTDYTGYDPEIGKGGGDTGSSALARVDGYTYPNFRTYTLGIEVNF
jgi:TonB-linked SusC/RagA family outer membrane protein